MLEPKGTVKHFQLYRLCNFLKIIDKTKEACSSLIDVKKQKREKEKEKEREKNE